MWAYENVYGCMPLGEIILPTSDLQMDDFLDAKSFEMLFRIKVCHRSYLISLVLSIHLLLFVYYRI